MINQQRAYFNFDKFIIDGKIYRGQIKKPRNPPFYGNILQLLKDVMNGLMKDKIHVILGHPGATSRDDVIFGRESLL